jgi:hypothetical protein
VINMNRITKSFRLSLDELEDRQTPAFMVVGVVQDGAAKVEALDNTGHLVFQVPVPGTFPGGIRTVSGDITGDGTPDIVVVPGPGASSNAILIDGFTRGMIGTLSPFGDFTGGMFASTGDLTGDGVDDIVLTPDLGGGPRVVIIRGGDFQTIGNFFGIDDPNFRGGARTALGDINGDTQADLFVAAGFGGGPRVSVYDGAALGLGLFVHPVNDFFVFESTLRNGVFIASGDVNGDGVADVVLGGGPGGGPRVEVLSGSILRTLGSDAAQAVPLMNFFAGDVNQRSGVHVAARDATGDAKADILTGSGGSGEVLGFRALDGLQLFDITLTDDNASANGVYVG